VPVPASRTGTSALPYCLGVVEGSLGGGVVLLSGVALGGDEDCMESDELAGGAAESDGELGVLGGGLDCIALSEADPGELGPVACCREQAAVSVSALRQRINNPRFIEHLAIVA
jgi:hypothetical protein